MEFNTLEAAMGFLGGCLFMAPVMWRAFVVPYRDDLKQERSDHRDLMMKLINKAGEL